MKVLLLSLFHPELVRGGAQQVCYELFEGLKASEGVDPTLLAAIDPTLPAFYKSGARITGFDGREKEFLFLSREYDYLWHKTANWQLLDAYAEFLILVQPDVVHFHHFLLFGIDLVSLTRAVLPCAKIIFTLHEFVAICSADGQMVRTTDASLCSRATPVRCSQCFPDRGPEHFFLREKWFKAHLDKVDLFTAPSRFMIDIYGRWGLDTRRIRYVANGQSYLGSATAPNRSREKRNRFGFFGQFVDNKGISVLLEAVKILRSEGFVDFTVDLNGDNLKYASPRKRAEIELFLEQEAERSLDARVVTFNGSYQVDQLSYRMERVDWCVVPSVWFETFGLVISEAWMFGKPVICSNVGAMAERVSEGKDGILFSVGDPRALARAMKRAATEDGLWELLASGIEAPKSRDTMVNEYLELYRQLTPKLDEA